MTVDSVTTDTAVPEDVLTQIPLQVRAAYPEDVAVLGVPISCFESGMMWAMPVRFICGTHYVALHRLESASTRLVSMPREVQAMMSESIRLPTLCLVEGVLQIVVHTRQGDRRFPF
jgi:hypothetical protein